jgi:hypothetical protein
MGLWDDVRAFSERRRSGSKCEGLAKPILGKINTALTFLASFFCQEKKEEQQ